MAENNHFFEEMDWRIRVYESLSFPTLILRPNRVIVNVNQVFQRQFSHIDEVVGKHCHEIFYHSPKACAVEECPLPKVMADKKGHSILTRIIDDQSREKWEDRVFSPILNDDGDVVYIMESIRDVTQTKTLEKRLTGMQEFFERVVQSSPSAILAADCEGKILIMNEAAEDLFGYDLEKALTIHVQDLYPPGEAKEIMKHLRDESYGGRGKLPATKSFIIDAHGKKIPVEMTAAIIYSAGLEVATTAIYNDLREKLTVEKKLKETQAQLVQSEKMASMGQLAAGVAHELNNPLTGILFYASLAIEELNKDHPLVENLHCIVEDVHRCKGIVKNLLTYSRQSSPSKNVIHLSSLVNESLNLIRDKKLFGNIVIDKHLSDDMMLIHVDKNQIIQVIINLVMNAGAAMNGEGVLTLRAFRDKPGKKVYLEISDTGCGIPEENFSKIFDPFFTTKQPGKGTGLGLSTSYGIITEHGGNISVKETGSWGTTFEVELPLYVASENGSLQ